MQQEIDGRGSHQHNTTLTLAPLSPVTSTPGKTPEQSPWVEGGGWGVLTHEQQ